MFAIQFKNVSKIYNLYGSQKDQFIDLLGLQRFGIKPKTTPKKFVALNDISLEIKRGQRIGIIGRNGAGKTTLLKLLCGNFLPTQGSVKVNGEVQALMSVGLGFHPEYTGRENAETSLQYSGLAFDEYENAMEEIIDFCELGDFLDQPFKTYSLGMQARLMFAAATAIKPDILIVDEVLGAGDAYFVAKSNIRVKRMIDAGCTMLLVSHSMQQVLELCDEVIWLDNGAIRMRGKSFLVVKAYEEYIHGPIGQILLPNPTVLTNVSNNNTNKTSCAEISDYVEINLSKTRIGVFPNSVKFQEPFFLPHKETPNLPNDSPIGYSLEAPGGISRWKSDLGVKVVGFSVVSERGSNNNLIVMRPAKFAITLVAERDGLFNCRYGIEISDPKGDCKTKVFSPSDYFEIKSGATRQIEMLLNPCQIGPGEYIVGLSVLDYSPIEKINSTKRYDLLSRSFSIRVELPETLNCLSASFVHTAEWKFF